MNDNELLKATIRFNLADDAVAELTGELEVCRKFNEPDREISVMKELRLELAKRKAAEDHIKAYHEQETNQ